MEHLPSELQSRRIFHVSCDAISGGFISFATHPVDTFCVRLQNNIVPTIKGSFNGGLRRTVGGAFFTVLYNGTFDLISGLTKEDKDGN